MSKPYDFLIFIGRFQPFHYGHASVIERALEEADHVLVLIGSANQPRSVRNPFLFDERATIIHNWASKEHIPDLLCSDSAADRIHCLPLDDFTYNDQGWIAAVQTVVAAATNTIKKGWTDKPPKIGLIGHSKDESSYYLGLFPQWGSINVPPFTDRKLFNSTDVRNVFFSKDAWETADWDELEIGIPAATNQFLKGFRQTDDFEWLFNEHQYVVKYRMDHRYAKSHSYEPTHTTVDAVVVQSGHVLVIRRGAHPGKGQMCLPGGFIDPGETLLDGMLRELYEETKLKVPKAVLAGNVKQQMVFDDPNRSARGRVFSHAFLIVLPPRREGLPVTRASSDAQKNSDCWIPLSELDPREFFEDHYHIIHKMTSGL